MTGNDDTAAPPPTKPGDTRFWCSCDPDRQRPFFSSADLVQHVMGARASEASHALLSAAR
jgi:hypothetical protein